MSWGVLSPHTLATHRTRRHVLHGLIKKTCFGFPNGQTKVGGSVFFFFFNNLVIAVMTKTHNNLHRQQLHYQIHGIRKLSCDIMCILGLSVLYSHIYYEVRSLIISLG